MKEFIEKLNGRLEETKSEVNGPADIVWNNAVKMCIYKANRLAEEYNNDFCEWEQNDKEIDVYFTQCGQAHIFCDGNPEENSHVYCPYCGKKIKIAPYQTKGE